MGRQGSLCKSTKTILWCYSDQWDGQGEPLVALEDDTADETYVMMEFENVGLY